VSSHIFFDLSRLLWRSERFAPTGIDRVELAYARHLIATARERVSFVGWWNRLGLMPDDLAIALIDRLDALWSGEAVDPAVRKQVLWTVRRLRANIVVRGEQSIRTRAKRVGEPLVYLLVSHYRLDRPKALERIKQRTGARFVCLIHDVIPIEYPEHVEEGDPEQHRRRIDTVEQLADWVIVNSQGTMEALRRHLAQTGTALPVTVAPLGLDLKRVTVKAGTPAGQPYFIFVATIESRKNHLLLLDVWERLVADLGSAAPRLVIVGRRGWMSQKVVGRIAGSRLLSNFVDEYNTLPDAALARLLAGARAALYPSFAEGYGLPVAEALALGVPVICSDLAELREVALHVPEYLDPRDAQAWYNMIVEYTRGGSTHREGQLARLSTWVPSTWGQHFRIVQPVIDEASPTPTKVIRPGALAASPPRHARQLPHVQSKSAAGRF
jgi:glycosyltransferase involved in cell wall biosynthesis